MCAINPVHKKRILFDFYSTSPVLTEKEFKESVLKWTLTVEQTINTYSTIRVHVKETDQEAE